MKAILINDDKSLSWREVPDPVLKSDEVLVEIHAAALNRADLMQREGNYPPPPGCPEWMGLEIAGIITAMGEEAREKSDWKCGDRVCALLGGGGYAETAAVRYDMLMPVPAGCSMEEAAAIPEAFATAWLNLFIEGKAKAGDTLLITGGNSGLASVTIRLAKAFGLRVITTVRGQEKAAAIGDLGADIIVDTTKEDLSHVLKKELENVPLIKQIIACTKCFPMDRSDVRQSLEVIKAVTEEVQSGRSYIIFPEGTRSRNGNVMGEFHGGSFRCAVKAKCPIIPMAVIDCFKVLDQKGSKPVRVQLHYLKPISYEEYAGMKAAEVAALVKERIQACLDEYAEN